MNDQDKTKEELIKELQELQQENNSLKASCNKDNTERKQAKQELIIANKELVFQNEEKEKLAAELIIAKVHAEGGDRLKSAFLSNMSHEIRTPMNGILVFFAEMFKGSKLTGEEQQEYISIIEKSRARMLNIIKDIVDIKKKQSWLINVNVKESNVNEQIEFIYTFFKPEVEGRGMQLFFKNSLPLNEAIIKTDHEKVSAILINLVKNAIKYSAKGSIFEKRNMKILVIDDNPVNLKLILAILNRYFPDYQVILSQSGIEGIEIAKRELPDTILLDILMPEMDGFEVCDILKNNESTRHIPILLVSAMGEMRYRIKGLNAGADAFISKPIYKAELKAQVNVMLRIKFAEDLLRKRNENLEIRIKKQTDEFHNIEERYLKVSGYALEYFWEVDQSGQFTYVSPVIVKILGFDSEEIVGIKSLYDFCSYNENTESKAFMADIFARRENFTGNEILCSHKNGKKVWLTISGFPIFDRNNNFTGYIGVNHDITRRREAEEANKKHLEKINEYQKKLKNLYYELTVAEEKERRKIAEYLHDGLGQIISIASIKLSAIARGELPPAVKKTLEESTELLHNAISESRTLVYDLSPPILYELGLIAAIKWKLEQIEKKTGVKTVFLSEENSIKLKTDMTILIFRMVCELLNNAIKHAGADLITVEITKNPQNIIVRVIDNGKGFDLSQGMTLSELGGFGLFSINERLDALQGSMEIDSKISQGAKITLTIPI